MAVTGDIKVSNNFQVNTARPLDCKTVVGAVSELSDIPFPYVGLITYVEELQCPLVLVAMPATELGNWKKVGSGVEQKAKINVAMDGQTVFTLAFTPASITGLFVNGLAMVPDDWQLDGNVLTFLEKGFLLEPSDYVELRYTL